MSERKRCLRTLTRIVSVLLILAAGTALVAQEEPPKVKDDTTLRAALEDLKPGTTVRIAAGEYRGGLVLSNVHGTAEAPVIIEGADRKNPPVIKGGKNGLHLSDCSYLELVGLTVQGASQNGINIDDANTFDTPTHHLVIQDVTILKTGPTGNNDALKLSGVNQFIVRRCRFEGWGGSGIDMVGCHQGLVEDCSFVGMTDHRQGNGVQIKGGSSNILVQTSFFKDAGERSVNVGGVTGEKWFRPKGADYEARHVTIAGNRFVGSTSPIAWVGSHNTLVQNNIFYHPGKYVVRILQENTDPHLTPCRNGRFENNLIVIDANVNYTSNVGPGTKPRSFSFKHNAWFREGRGLPPILPTPEQGGIRRVNPRLTDPGTASMSIGPKDPRLAQVGPAAWKPFKPGKDFADLAIPDVAVPGSKE